MKIDRSNSFIENQFEIAEFSKALAHPIRISILEFLMQSDNYDCGNLRAKVGVTQTVILEHLNALKEIGVIDSRILNAKTCYCINDAKWNEIQEKMANFFKSYPIFKQC
jgi:predicted transcriptional regulator